MSDDNDAMEVYLVLVLGIEVMVATCQVTSL